MKLTNKLSGALGAGGLALFAALPAWAQNVAEAAAAPAAPAAAAPATLLVRAPTVEQTLTMVNKGDTTWMMVSTALVLMMAVPALGLFYGGLVRTKNMLSVLMQTFMTFCVCALVWACWGYSIAFTSGGENHFFGGLSKAFMMGVTPATTTATFSNNVYFPEFVYFIFQMTFASITPAIIVGAFAERIKFTPLMIFMVLWLTLVYCPIAHMVWYWAGPDFLPDTPNDYGYLWGLGALDFAGGTVVHINAGIAGMAGCLIMGKRLGYKQEPMAPHSLVMTMIGGSLLWVGWFGFNVGSNLEANGIAGLVFANTFLATAAAAAAWVVIEQIVHGKPSLLGAVTGAIAGLVAITPACGFAAPMTSILLGFAVSAVCFFFVTTVKNRFGYDDTLDVFGVHCVGGIVGALGTAIVAAPSLGGQGYFDYTQFPAVAVTPEGYSIAHQLWVQLQAVLLTLVWSGGVSAVLFFLLDKTVGLRPSAEIEHEGLDINEHGERAYNY